MKRLAWVLVTGYLITQWEYTSPVTLRRMTVCLYDTIHGRVEIVQRGLFCSLVRQIDVE